MALRPFAAIDPRRLDNPDTGGINTVTGQSLKTLTQTQSTSPNVPAGVDNGVNAGFGANVAEFGNDPPIANTDPGAGASDDGTTAGIQDVITTQNAANQPVASSSRTRPPVQPRPNVLDKLSSYTYRASVYLMSPADYQTFLKSEKRSINGYNLLFQSGGAPTNSTGFKGALDQAATGAANPATNIPGANSADAGRNPAFPLDFYIDSISLRTLTTGSSGSAHSAAEFKMTVVEPMNITLLDRLYEAVQDHNPKGSNGAINYVSAQYLLVIRFYGYDAQGNMVRGGDINTGSGLTDPNAVIEKFIPFIIRNINWTVGKGAVSYEFECAPVPTTIPLSSDRGTVPYDIELTNQTVGQLLGGKAAITTNSATAPGLSTTATEDEARDMEGSSNPPSKADAAKNPNGTLTSGLMQALTEFRKSLTQQPNGSDPPVFEQYDEYAIEFVGEAKQLIENASIVLSSDKDARSTPMAQPPTSNAAAANPDTNSKDTKSKSFKIVAGQPIIQVIEQIIRNSSYVLNQQIVKVDADNNNTAPQNNSDSAKQVNWFNITFKAEPKPLPDPLRNDYAYKMTYYVSVYPVNKYESKYFPVAGWPGVHKSYNWWFTGQNTAVIDYQETFNQAYQNLVSGTGNKDSNQEIRRRTLAQSQREMAINAWAPRSSETSQGAREREYEAAANLAGSLYEPDALVESQLRIIGDPAWIMQGSIAGGSNPATLLQNSSGFLPDGTINFDYSQVFYEVTYNQPTDYDLNSGLANPITNKGKNAYSRVYIAKEVQSEFKQGKFEQTIKGALFTLPKPDGSNLAPGKSGVNTQNTVPETANTSNTASQTVRNPNQTAAVAARTGVDLSRRVQYDASNDPRLSTTAGGQGGGSTVPAAAVSVSALATVDALGNPIAGASAPTPENPPEPATSNGLIAGLRNFFGPPKSGQGRNRISVPNNPQLIAKDD